MTAGTTDTGLLKIEVSDFLFEKEVSQQTVVHGIRQSNKKSNVSSNDRGPDHPVALPQPATE